MSLKTDFAGQGVKRPVGVEKVMISTVTIPRTVFGIQE